MTGIPQISMLDDIERAGQDEGGDDEQGEEKVVEDGDRGEAAEGKEQDEEGVSAITEEKLGDSGDADAGEDGANGGEGAKAPAEFIVLKVLLDEVCGLPDPRKNGALDGGGAQDGDDAAVASADNDDEETAEENQQPLPTYFARVSLYLRHGLSR